MRALTAGALLLLTFPAGAGATDYGGGTAPDSVARADRQLTLVALRVADDRPGRAAVKVAAGCGLVKANHEIGVAADGTFGYETTENGGTVGGVQRSSVLRLSGQIVGPVASGTVRARLTFRRRGRVIERCDSGVREWNARAAGATTGAGAAYYGLTSQTGDRSRSYSVWAAHVCRWRPSTTACAAAAATSPRRTSPPEDRLPPTARSR